MFSNNKNELNDRVTALEIAFEERWVAHDKRSAENWSDMKDHLNSMSSKIDKMIETAGDLPCGEMKEKLKGFNTRLGWLWTVVISVIVMGIALGIWVKPTPRAIKQPLIIYKTDTLKIDSLLSKY